CDIREGRRAFAKVEGRSGTVRSGAEEHDFISGAVLKRGVHVLKERVPVCSPSAGGLLPHGTCLIIVVPVVSQATRWRTCAVVARSEDRVARRNASRYAS